MPVGIITGRSLDVIKKKVTIPGIAYGASHGIEWDFGLGEKQNKLSKEVAAIFTVLNREVGLLVKRHPAVLRENRPFGITFHYHACPRKDWPAIKRDVIRLLWPINSNKNIKIFWERQTVDIVSRSSGTKGDIALSLHRHFLKSSGKKLLPIYIGDGITDEDAFTVLKNIGLTIRVGKSKASVAQYFLKKQSEVNQFLTFLASQIIY